MAFMVGLAFAIAASANFPALLLSMFWRRFTTRGAVASMLIGTLSARCCSSSCRPRSRWTSSATPTALFPLKNPGLITMPLSFLVGVVVSLLLPEPEAPRPLRRGAATACTWARRRTPCSRRFRRCPPTDERTSFPPGG